MIKVKDGYAKLIGTTYSGSADRLLLSNGGDKAVSDFAVSSHKHSAADITSGTLSVSRGGTGATSFTSGAALIGNGTGAVSTRSITSSATKDSTSLITSGGVYSALAGKMNASITSIELNTSGGLKSYGGFIDFHFHDSNGTPLNASGEVTSDGKTPDYTSRIIEDAAGTISVNGVKFKGNKVTASGGFVGNLTGNVTGNVTGNLTGNVTGDVTGNASSATNADKLDNIDSTGFMRVISQNATWSSVENIPTNLTPGVHAVHISGKEYSSILAGNDYTGAQWQLYFHPHASYLGSIKYRYSGDNVWKTILDSSNSSVSKDGQTLTVKINGSEQSLTNSTYNFSGVSFTSGNQNTGEHNCNNIKSNGVWYYTSNGPTTTLGATTNDGALYSQAYSTSWVAQIAQDYRNGNLYTRGLNSGSWSSWRKVAYVDDTVRNAYYMRTMESGNSNWYTGWKAWFKWLDSSTLGIKITNANTDDNTDVSSYKFKADLAGIADSATTATTATTATNLTNKPALLISGNTIAVKAGEKTSDYITVPYATKAYMVSSYEVASSSDVKRRIWLDWTSKDGKVAYSDDLTYQTNIKTLFAPYLYGKITVPGGSYSWYQVQQYNSSDANPSYYDATCAIVNINSYTGWQPWIRGVDSEKGSWTIGQYTTNLHIGYIPKSNTTNGLTYRWDFGKDGSTIFPGSIKFNTILIPTSSGGSTYGVGSNGQVLKSNGSTVYWASDSNSNTWRAIQVNGTQIAGTGTGTKAVNFVSGTGMTVTGATADPNTITMSINSTYQGYISNGNAAYGWGNHADVGYAKQQTWNDFIHSGNEFTFASPAYSSYIWFNYRTASGKTDGAITGYKFGNGKGGELASIDENGVYSGTAATATTAEVLLTNNTSQNADSCYSESPGLRFWRFNGTGNTSANGGDGWIMSWSWNTNSVGGQLYFDDNPSKTMLIRGYNSDKTFTTWSKILHSDNYTGYVNETNFPGLNKTGTVTSVKVGTTSYSPSSGVVSLPAYPSVGNGKVTIKQNNTEIGSFTLNQSSAATINLTDTIYSAFTGATSSAAGSAGLVPAPAKGAQNYYLRGDATWQAPNWLPHYNGSSSMTSADVVNTPSYIHTVSSTGGSITTITKPAGMDNAWGIIHLHTHTGNYATQLGFGGTTGKMYFRNAYNSATFSDWATLATEAWVTGKGYVTSSGVTSVTVKGSNGLSGSGTVTSTGTITLSNSGVRSTTINGDYLRVNTNGTNSDLTIPYATAATKLKNYYSSRPTSIAPGVIGDGSMFHFKCTSSVTDTTTDPGDAHILHFNWDNTGGYDFQIAGLTSNSVMKIRGMNGGTWQSWATVLTNANYTDYVNATNFPGINKTGTVTKVSTGTGLTGGDITSTGTISINSTYQTYISNGNTAYGWGNHASAGYMPGTPYGIDLKGVSNPNTPYIDFTHYDTISNDYDYRIICNVKGTAGTNGKGTCQFEGTSNFKGDVLTATNNTYNLGSSSKVWKNVYATTFNGTATALLNFTTKRGETDGAVDCNTVTSNGMWYWGSNGPSTTIGADYTDGALYSIAYSNSWVTQISQGFRNGELFTRARNNGTWTSWRRLAYADGIGNGTVTVNQNSSSKGSFTLNQAGNATINLTDYYPTTFAWTAGTTAGPTGSLTGVGMSAVSFAAIPSASASASGIVTTSTQTFAGEKTFSAIRLRSASTTNYGGYLYFGDSAYCYIHEPTDDAMSIYSAKGVTISTAYNSGANGQITLNSALNSTTSASTSYRGVVCDGMYLKSAAYHIGTVTKLQPETATTTVSQGYGISGVTIAQSKTRGGKRTITITNSSGFTIYVHSPNVSALFLDKGEGSCIEHGFAYIKTGVSFPYTLSTGNSLSFDVIYGYVHTQGNWSTGDFTKSNDLGGFTCSVYASRYV